MYYLYIPVNKTAIWKSNSICNSMKNNKNGNKIERSKIVLIYGQMIFGKGAKKCNKANSLSLTNAGTADYPHASGWSSLPHGTY